MIAMDGIELCAHVVRKQSLPRTFQHRPAEARMCADAVEPY